MICPNINIKEVKDGFNEIVVALGGKPLTDEEFRSSELRNQRQGVDFAAMEATYKVYHRNNGNMLDLAPNGEHSVLFESLLDYYSGDRAKAIAAKSKVYSDEFINWFGDWTGNADSEQFDEETKKQISLIFKRIPKLSEIGTEEQYAKYIQTIFPESLDKSIYWHGSNSDFSEGFNSAKREEGSGAPETKKRNDFYLAKLAWTVLQYVNGVNRKSVDKNGFSHWNKLWWEFKEIMSNGRRENNDWKDLIINEETVRQAIPNKKGIFNRDKGGNNGKWLKERKADYGYENKSDKEFFEEILGVKWGEDTFNTWTKRNEEIFKSLQETEKGIYPAVINTQNPIRESGQNTYYEEDRGLFTQADANNNDAILSSNADNEFNSDIAVVLRDNERIHFLGTEDDIKSFKKFVTGHLVSKVVDENGEPLVVWHGSKESNKINIFYNIPTYFADKYTALSYTPFDAEDETEYMYPVFLNIRNPKQVDGNGAYWSNINGMTTNDIVKSISEEEDGVIIENIKDYSDFAPGNPDLSLDLVKDAPLHTDYITTDPNQIKSATDNNGEFSTLNNDIQKTVLSESEYNDMVEEMNLDQDKTDSFLYNFITKILRVNPRKKVDYQNDTFNFEIIKGDVRVNFESIEDLAKKIFGFYSQIDMSSKENFEKDIDDLLDNWSNYLIEEINNPIDISSYYTARNKTRDNIKLLLRFLDHNLKIEDFNEDEQQRIRKLTSKPDGSSINTKQGVGYKLKKLKDEQIINEQSLTKAIYSRSSKLIAAKNRLVALNTIDNLKQLVKLRLLAEYESYLPTELQKQNANRFENLVKSIEDVINSKNTDRQLDGVFKSDVEHLISYEDFLDTILESYPEYSDLIKIFKNANPKLKIVIGVKQKEEVAGIVPGWFSPKNNTLYISKMCDIYTCIHELAHSATYYGMMGRTENTEAFSSLIEKFMNYIRDFIKQNKLDPDAFRPTSIMGMSMPALIYGFTNPSEFIAELFGNPKFQDLLQLIPAMENKQFKSLFHQIWDTIVNFLNNLLGNNKVQKTALDLAKNLGLTCCQLQQQHIDEIYSQLNEIQQNNQNSLVFQLYYDDQSSKTEFLKNKVSKLLKNTDFKLKFSKTNDRYAILSAKRIVKDTYTFEELKDVIQRFITEAGGSIEDFNIYPSDYNNYSIVVAPKQGSNLQKTVLNNTTQLLLDLSITQQMYDVNSQIETEREQYINSVLTQYIQNNPNAKQEDISRVQNSARQLFNIDKSNELLKQHQVRLAQTFGLALNRSGYYESQEQTQNKLLLEYMINSLQEDTFLLYNADNINRTKYQQVGAVKNATSIGNILYNALYEGDITTLDKAMARDYVRIFWGSDLIQSALDSLNNGTKTSEQLENELVERMTREPVESRDTSIIDWFNNIWTTLSNLVKQVFGAHNFTAQQQADILKAVDAAFMIAKDLEYTLANARIYDREDGKFDSSTILSEKDKKVLSNIRHGLVTRIKSQMARTSKNQKLILDLKQRLEVIDARREDSIDDVFNIIEDFLINANTEIGRTRLYIDRTLLGPNYNMDNWDPQQINFIQQDLIGYYDNLLSIVSELFSDNMSVINKYDLQRSQTNPNAISISRFVAQLKSDVNSLKESYNKDIVLRYVKKLCTDYVNEEDAITDKKTFVYNMNKWIEQDSAYGDLAAGEVLIGMASRSKSPIVRIVEKFASQADYATSREVLKKGNELMRLYNKVRPTGSQISWNNWQKRFMEFDRDGIPTGYFVREVNAGQFYKDKDAKELELRIKYNLQADEDGNTIFPEEEFTKNDSIYNKYYDELDTWLDQHCERRYTLDYYKAKRRFLSPKTLQAQGSLQRQIDLIIDKARDKDGFVDMRKISANEKHQLEILRKKKRDLGSHYIFTEAAGGVLRVEEKVGDALKIADEISAWNKFIADKVKYKPDWTAFNQAKQNLIDNGATADEIRQFERANTVDRITNEFYELLRKVTGKGVTNPEIESLQRRYSEILSALKDRQGAGSHNLNKLGLGLNTDMSGWKELHRIEQRISDIKRQLKLNGAKGVAGDTSQFTFDDLATNLYVTVSDGNPTTYLEYLTQMWRSAAASNTNLALVFNDTFMVKDERGRYKYLKAFTYLTPRNYTLDINGQTINCIQSLPGSEYSELDESSPYVNLRFKKDGASMQPKDSYKNPKYAELTSDELDFLNKLKETMSEAYGMIPNRSTSIEDMLPQISGRTASVLANTLRAKEWSTALKYPFRDLGVSYSETDQDVSTNMDLARRPDGTVVNNIPIRFIRKLKNPSVQSTDVLGSVMMFYDMACNYKNKSQNLPTLELIKYAITPGMISTTNSMKDQYAKVENILDQRYYGKETSFGFDSNEKITEAKLRTIQTTKTIRNWAAVAMLGINFTTIEVGYIDACLSMFADAIGSKYFTTEDYKYALKECIMHTRKMLIGLGNAVVDDKLVAAMQYNQLSRSNAEIFSMTDKFKLDRFVKQHCLMGGYTMTDYMINSMMLMATYHHYRLIKDPKTGKEKFYSKTDAINEFTKLGYSEKEAIKLWKNSKTILWDAYELKDGLLVIKAGFKDKINKKLEDRIAGRLRDRTAMYNGVIPQTEKAKLQQNVFGSFITLMRNFYVNTYWDRFKTGGDYIKEDDDHNITWKSEYKRDDLGMVNLETGEFEGAVFKDFCRGIYKLTGNLKYALRGLATNKLTREQRYAVARSITELGMITGLMFLMMWSVAFARANDYDDDKDPAWTLNLIGEGRLLDINLKNSWDKFRDFMRWKFALLFTRGFTERLTPWWIPTMTEIVSNPTTAYSYLEDISVIWGLAIDLFSQRAGEEIKTGGYKHMTRGTRDILKLLSPLGFDNLVRQWHTDGLKSTFNFYRGMAPTNSLIPTQTEYNEAHGKSRKSSKKKNKSSVSEYAE